METAQIYYFFMDNSTDRIIFSFVGILLSIYALYVEIRKEADPTFKAVCDLGNNVSCSKVLTSKYGRGFGIVEALVGKENFMNVRNCNLGILFYAAQIILSFFSWLYTNLHALLVCFDLGAWLCIFGIYSCLCAQRPLYLVYGNLCHQCMYSGFKLFCLQQNDCLIPFNKQSWLPKQSKKEIKILHN
ncbi:vitamin K epoxide reductase complex subunit 1 isoform X1 [Octopus sinensis]|uniref:vitamin-K-epoxide reductase (warfarin-sensitive) n=1 Tax=Octopus sinensis TaxID=2607531 RepID=A0A7E6FL57_9MOLL|nr:vitamin K epoxide reductase complex subunit 1 isoform X1 [Octopus sinensis]